MSQGIRHWIFWKKEIRAMLYLRRITSLNNLKNNRPIAQVATILILIIVAGLIFILATVNLGNVSLKTTQTANAADSSTLYLASQLASKANSLWNELDKKLEMCKKGGMLGIILAIIVAVVLTIATAGMATLPAMAIVMGGAAAAGAVGGAIVHGTAQGAAMGAIQGAAIGAGIYGGAYAFGGGPVPVEGGGMVVMTTGITSTSGAVGGGALATGVTLYNASAQESRDSATMSALAKQLSGLPQYESVREGVFYYALSQVVDDPNRVLDTNDLDSDGDTSETVSAFDYWWYNEHIPAVKAGLSSAADSIESFFESSLIPFYQEAKDFLSYMDRKEVECDCSPGESPSTLLFGAIKGSGYSIFWEPGPDKQSLINWYDCNRNDCQAPAGFDTFDGARMQYEEFIDYSTGLLKPDESGGFNYDADTLDKALRNRPGVAGEDNWDWFDFLYNPDTNEDFYDVFKTISPTIGAWNENIIGVRDGLAGCKLAYTAGLDDSVYQAGSFCQCYPPLYPCNWLRTGSSACGEPYDECGLQSICSDAPREPSCGIWIPNPLCKLYAADKEALLAQIQAVEDFVSNLEEHIKAKYFPEPCPDCSLVGDIEIQVLEICLSDGTISYRFHYKYTCSCCDEVCDPEGNCEPVCTDTTYQGEMWGEDSIAAPDLQIISCPAGQDCPSKGGFLGILSEMRGALGSVGDDFATIDEDWEDEFKPVIEKLEEQIGVIEGFLPDVERFNDDIEGVTNTRAVDGRGEVTYSWEDSLGKHSVKVETGPFKLAYIKKKTSGSFLKNKTCLQLRDYEDDGSRTWVEITRQDPGEKEITSSGTTNLGLKWNPFFSGEITRKSKAYYSYDKVGIKGIK